MMEGELWAWEYDSIRAELERIEASAPDDWLSIGETVYISHSHESGDDNEAF